MGSLLARLRGARLLVPCTDPSNFTECFPPVDGKPTHVAVEVADHALACEAVELLAEVQKWAGGSCATMHHQRGTYHGLIDPCPVEARLDDFLRRVRAALAAKEPND